jgi:hypothetical protein
VLTVQIGGVGGVKATGPTYTAYSKGPAATASSAGTGSVTKSGVSRSYDVCISLLLGSSLLVLVAVVRNVL